MKTEKTDKPTTLRDRMAWGKSNVPFGSKPKPEPPPQTKPPVLPRVWLIDPESQSVTFIDEPDFHSLINEVVGADATDFELDSHTVLWASNIDSNETHSYHLERMGGPFSQRRFSRGLVVSLPPNWWDEDTLSYYVRFTAKNHPLESLSINYKYGQEN